MTVPIMVWMTDFGDRDGFSGVMKGVALSLLSDRTIPMVDLSHSISPHDVLGGAWVLKQALPYFCSSAVFVAVVDPHVGSPNQAQILAYWADREQVFIAPDNGLLTPVFEAAGEDLRIYKLKSLDLVPSVAHHPPSSTFHGRDVYAPLGALAINAMLEYRNDGKRLPVWLESVGAITRTVVTLPQALPQKETVSTMAGPSRKLRGRIDYVDQYGNLITNIPSEWVEIPFGGHLSLNIKAGRQIQTSPSAYTVPWVLSYQAGFLTEEPVFAVPGSHGMVELASYEKSAAARLKGAIGDLVSVTVHQGSK